MSENDDHFHYFDSEECLNCNLDDYAIIILNQPLDYESAFLIPFWNKAKLRMTTDGGTNRWNDYLKNEKIQPKVVKPIDIISGDFDSITAENLNKIKNKMETRVILTEDQDETDFTKAIKILIEYITTHDIKVTNIFAICQSAGRIDQIIANINTLYKISELNMSGNHIQLSLFARDSFSWLLVPGKHAIKIPPSLKKSKNGWCALIPMGEKSCHTKTTGLMWDLDGTMEMKFGGMVSTSNTYGEKEIVTVENDVHLLWCMGILPLFSHIYKTADEER